MDETDMENFLTFAIEEGVQADDGPMFDLKTLRIQTFKEAGVLSGNKGLVVRVEGVEFQITIVRSN